MQRLSSQERCYLICVQYSSEPEELSLRGTIMIFNITQIDILAWPRVFEIPQRSKQREEEDVVSNLSAVK